MPHLHRGAAGGADEPPSSLRPGWLARRRLDYRACERLPAAGNTPTQAGLKRLADKRTALATDEPSDFGARLADELLHNMYK